MNNTKEKLWHISDIEALTEAAAKAMSVESMEIKGHQVYFVDFEGYFKYSALVFAEGRHIYHANEYELHHGSIQGDRTALRERYVQYLTQKLFTEEELVAPTRDYMEYQRKTDFLHNYYGMRREHESIFHINPTKEETRAFQERIQNMTLNPVCFAYYTDKEFVQKCIKLRTQIEKSWKERRQDPMVMRDAFVHEMYNHEYSINWQADYDTLSAFGNIRYQDVDYTAALHSYFDQLGFSEDQRAAYYEARKEYFRQIGEGETA